MRTEQQVKAKKEKYLELLKKTPQGSLIQHKYTGILEALEYTLGEETVI
jgi:hypothetical protein